MINAHINLIQAKYPEKILAALDNRSTALVEASSGKDLFRSTPAIRARKPRSRDIVDFCELDEDLCVLSSEAETMVYYTPSGTNQYCTYTTDVAVSGDTLAVVAEIAQAALVQSLSQHGKMKQGEARIFWMLNEQSIDLYPLIYTTVVREKWSYHIAAEVGRSQSGCYTSLFSFALPEDTLVKPVLSG